MRFGGRGGFGGGRRFGGSRFDRNFERNDEPKPIKVGEEYDVEIKETGSKGDGIARIKNFVVFVNGTKLGDKAHVKITEVRNRFAIAEKTGEATGATTEVSEKSEGEETEMKKYDDEDNEEGDGSSEEGQEDEE